MNEILVIVKKDIKEALRSKAFLVGIGVAIFIIYMLTTVARDNIRTLLEKGTTAVELTSYIQPIIGAAIFTVVLVVSIYFSFFINNYTLLIEKMKRSLESLLCTPLSLRQLWLGKTMAMLVPSITLGLLVTLVAFCAMNIFVVSPQVGHWIYPGVAPLVATLLVIPFIVLFLSALFSLLQLIITNVRWVNAAFMIIFIGTMNGLMFSLRFSASSWSVVYISLGVAAILAVADFFLAKLLTKERIILSSKG